MSFCQACGSAVDSDARFCPRCGKPANIGVLSNSPELPATANPGLPLTSAAAAPPAVVLQSAPATTSTVQVAATVAIAHHHKRPIGVIIIAILALLCVVFAVPVAIALLYYSANVGVLGETPLAQFLIALFPVIGQAKTDLVSALNLAALESFAIAGIAAASCYGLIMLREWGRILAMVGIVLAMLHAVIVTFTGEGNLLWHLIALGIQTWALTYLLKARVKVCFAK